MIKCTLQFWWKSNQHCPNHYFTIIAPQIKSNQVKCWFLMKGENRSTRGKTSHSRTENQQTRSTYDGECGNRTRCHSGFGPPADLDPPVHIRLRIWTPLRGFGPPTKHSFFPIYSNCKLLGDIL